MRILLCLIAVALAGCTSAGPAVEFDQAGPSVVRITLTEGDDAGYTDFRINVDGHRCTEEAYAPEGDHHWRLGEALEINSDTQGCGMHLSAGSTVEVFLAGDRAGSFTLAALSQESAAVTVRSPDPGRLQVLLIKEGHQGPYGHDDVTVQVEGATCDASGDGSWSAGEVIVLDADAGCPFGAGDDVLVKVVVVGTTIFDGRVTIAG